MSQKNQLVEMKDINQNDPAARRRLFVAGIDALTVWYDPQNTITGFQLTMDEVAISHTATRFTVQKIDYSEKDNLAPMLLGNTTIGLRQVLDYLDAHGTLIDKEIMNHIKAMLSQKLT